MKRAIFLDRDGVLNRMKVFAEIPRPPESILELEILPGVERSLAMLKAAGFVLIVVTNQPDVARGTIPRANVEEIHRLLLKKLPLDAIEVCFHDDVDNCECRKPKPGMLLRAAKTFNVDLENSYLVGDRGKDIQAGMTAKCHTILVGLPHRATCEVKPEKIFPSLTEATVWILESSK